MTAPLWTAAELGAATGGALAAEVAVGGVSIDSRAIGPGELFVALRDARDGHDFVADALARGAAAAMVDRDPPGVPPDAPLLRVADTLAGLTALGAAGRARGGARVVAVTGSVGKTTTKEMLRRALSALGPTHAAEASHNNHWGVPLTLARLPRDAAFAVIEIGMNHRGEIAPLSRLARPHAAVITTVAPAHIGHLGSLEAIADEKADILAGLEPDREDLRGPLGLPGRRGDPPGAAVLPADNPLLPRLRAAARRHGVRRVLTFGRAEAADVRLVDAAVGPESTRCEVRCLGRRLDFTLAAPGEHLALNACAALGAVAALGADPEAAAAALSGFGAVVGRGMRVTLRLPGGGTALLLDDSYNASTASIRAGLAVLAAQPAARRLAVLGDMRELGEHGPALHAELAPDVAACADLTFCCGALMRHLFDALPKSRRGDHQPDSASLAPVVRDALRPGDAVLVKGSLGSRMKLVVEALTQGARDAA